MSPPSEQPETSYVDLAPGTMFARRYRIIEQLGRGGMAAVYRAKDGLVGETVALKVSTGSIEDAAFGEEQRREVALARKVTHPHVARVYDLGFFDGALFVTMELIEGKSLNERARVGNVPIDEVVQIGRQLTSALMVAHEVEVLHLDIKPQNVIVANGRVPRAVLVDFGIAQALGSVGTGYGTPDYASPEQLAKEPLTGASDIYSLGIVLYELLARRRPFVGPDAASRALLRLSQPPRPLPDTVPPSMAAVVHAMLALNSKDRPQVRELEGELCAALDSILRADGSVSIARPTVRREPDLEATAIPLRASAPEPTARDDWDLSTLPSELGAALATAHRSLPNLGAEEAAIQASEAVLALRPKNAVATSLRALALTRLWNLTVFGRTEDVGERAVEAVAESLRGAGQLPDTHLADALIADYSGDTAYAVRALERALQRDPFHAFSHLILGRIEVEAGRGGFERLRLAYALDPTLLSTYTMIARDLVFRGDLTQAMWLLDEADSIAPGSNETLSLRVRIALWRRDADAAAKLLEQHVPGGGFIRKGFIEHLLTPLVEPSKLAQSLEYIVLLNTVRTSPKRRAFYCQLWAELCGTFGRPEGLRYVVNAAQLPLSDLRWIDACVALDPYRAEPAFKYARSLIEDRLDSTIRLLA
ncbi:MAG: protein kinase [Deltaproteobacteria bacterium]|nr:protein kinase [Deltaproteobacteria bacterium]